MGRRGDGLADWGEYAVEHLRGPVLTGIRRKVAAWRDPRARLIRKRRRTKRAAIGGGVSTGALGGAGYIAYSADSLALVTDSALDAAFDFGAFGLWGAALAAGLGTVGAARRLRRLNRIPLPEPPPEPVQLPPADSEAREPMRRLRDAEQSLHSSLARLAESYRADTEPVTDARATAARVAAALREVADRMVAVEGTIAHSPEDQRESLRAHVQRMRSELDDGVEQYGALVAAAGEAVAASGGTRPQDSIQDATDRLAGLASALHELSGYSVEPDSDTGRHDRGGRPWQQSE